MGRANRRSSAGGVLRDSASGEEKSSSPTDSSVRVAGLGRFGSEEMSRMPEKKDQASCVVDGQFPMDFGSYTRESNLYNVQEGDLVMIRQNKGSDYKEKNNQRLLGSARVRKVIQHSFSAEEMRDAQSVRKQLGKIWDENDLGKGQKIFTKDRFVDYNSEDVLSGRPHFALVLYKDEKRFDSPIENTVGSASAMATQGGGARLREGSPDYDAILQAS